MTEVNSFLEDFVEIKGYLPSDVCLDVSLEVAARIIREN